MAIGFVLALAHAPLSCAQTDLTTQQKTNERILELAKSTRTPAHDYVIGRGDSISVEVFEVPELSREVRVSQTGTIGLPLLPVRLFVVGLTELQVQQKIEEVLEANGLVSHPQVMVFVKEKRSKPIAVVGAVAHPMVVQADRPLSLVEVLAEAGGISADAGDVVIVTRGGANDSTQSSQQAEPPEIGPEETGPAAAGNPSAPPAETRTAQDPAQLHPKTSGQDLTVVTKQGSSAGEPVDENAMKEPASAATPPPVTDIDAPATRITVNLSEILEKGDTQNNISLQAGDVVTIPHAGIVYALGAVQRPGGFVANNDRAQLSTLKILALAGGVTRVAKQKNAIIIRKDSEGRQQSIPVDLAKIVKRETEDVTLRPSDILYVPDSHTKAALIRASEIAIAVGTSLAIYRIGTR